MDKYFVSRIAGTPRKWGIFSKVFDADKGSMRWKRHATFNSKDRAEDNYEDWNWLENETDSRVLQAMGWA